MRLLAALLLLAGVLLFLAPATAHASEAPDEVAGLTFADFRSAQQSGTHPRGPIEEPEDWIAVAGIVCYAVLPLVFVAGLGFLAYEMWTRNADAALFGAASSSAWIHREARRPSGLVLLRF